MHLPTFSLIVFAGLAVGQFSGLPVCAQGCASDQFTGGSYAGCGTDAKCICSNQDFLSNIACCIVGDCDQADQSSAVTFASQICSANGVSVPTAAVCTTGSNAQISGTAAANATGSGASATKTSAGSATTGSSGSAAWAPKQTAAMGMELLGLAAAGMALL